MWKLMCVGLFVIATVATSQASQYNVRQVRTRAAAVHYDNLPLESNIHLERSSKAVLRKVVSPHYYRQVPAFSQNHKNIAYPTSAKKTRLSKAKFRLQKQLYKTKQSPPKYKPKDPAGFGEPPISIYDRPTIQGFGEPPIDTFGSNSIALQQASNKYKDSFRGNNFNEESRPAALTHTSQFYGKRNKNLFTTKFRSKSAGKAWYTKDDIYDKKKHSWFPKEEANIVGGQYAEPPPRYISKPRKPAFEDKITHPSLLDSDTDISSSNVAPSYVNKHSNLAFSPQNLNDAFSFFNTR